MLFADLVAVSAGVAATRSRRAKVDLLATFLQRLDPSGTPIGVAYLSGDLPQGRIGVGYATLTGPLAPPAPPPPRLTVLEVDQTIDAIAAAAGPGSQGEKLRLLTDLLARATDDEQDFLVRLLLGELRQGALAGIMIDAIARAHDLPLEAVRRAVMLSGNAAAVAGAVARDGPAALESFRLDLFRPLQPMLAQSAEDPAAALARTGPAACEYKLDGARIQVHRRDGRVAVYTRSLADVTDRVPEVVAAVLGLPVTSIVLDGETIALTADGRPQPFQVTMSRFGRRAPTGDVPLSAFFFDCLHLDGDDLIDLDGETRWAALERSVPAATLVPRTTTSSAGTARRFLARALAAGHEGIMVKSLAAPYEAGRRGAAWIKVKPAHTLDLVVLAVEWGSGRRTGLLSNLHLGARDPATGDFVMLGKTFKGLTDEMLEWQTRRFLDLETGRRGHVVHVRPEQVVEIAFDGIQASPRYAGGLALRFARVKGYRDDKTAADADTIDMVRAIYEGTSR